MPRGAPAVGCIHRFMLSSASALLRSPLQCPWRRQKERLVSLPRAPAVGRAPSSVVVHVEELLEGWHEKGHEGAAAAEVERFEAEAGVEPSQAAARRDGGSGAEEVRGAREQAEPGLAALAGENDLLHVRADNVARRVEARAEDAGGKAAEQVGSRLRLAFQSGRVERFAGLALEEGQARKVARRPACLPVLYADVAREERARPQRSTVSRRAANMLFPKTFALSSCRQILLISSGIMVSVSGTDAMMPASALLAPVPAEGGRAATTSCITGKRKNFSARIQVARATSGTSPCVKKPWTPWAARKPCRSCRVVSCRPAVTLAILSARTRSTGYMMAAVLKAARAIGGRVARRALRRVEAALPTPAPAASPPPWLMTAAAGRGGRGSGPAARARCERTAAAKKNRRHGARRMVLKARQQRSQAFARQRQASEGPSDASRDPWRNDAALFLIALAGSGGMYMPVAPPGRLQMATRALLRAGLRLCPTRIEQCAITAIRSLRLTNPKEGEDRYVHVCTQSSSFVAHCERGRPRTSTSFVRSPAIRPRAGAQCNYVPASPRRAARAAARGRPLCRRFAMLFLLLVLLVPHASGFAIAKSLPATDAQRSAASWPRLPQTMSVG